ncbi:MAG TPA: peptide-methionine (R)-S-oxide reductase, partial [Elusimicrobiota bacterium]|nr:peptide-methionine (R)-S-oxide reductase [Elusimicrobiota bacterium]
MLLRVKRAALCAVAVWAAVGFAAEKRFPLDPKIVKTDAEWKKALLPEAYHVMREKGTEPAFQNKYWNNHDT